MFDGIWNSDMQKVRKSSTFQAPEIGGMIISQSETDT
jgi:hypothetical protein